MTRSAFGTHLTNVMYGYHGKPSLPRKARLDAAMADARERFPTAVGINASYPEGLDTPSDGPIKVSLTIKTSEVERYYR